MIQLSLLKFNVTIPPEDGPLPVQAKAFAVSFNDFQVFSNSSSISLRLMTKGGDSNMES
jgi:hypothetical protein